MEKVWLRMGEKKSLGGSGMGSFTIHNDILLDFNLIITI